jgi:enamine deaminase RidA (YjgF/YER057c/UK114 family)
MTIPEAFSTGVAHKIGRYSDAVRVPAGYEQIVTSGTPGLRLDGTLPHDFAEEARQAWRNVAEALAAAGAQLTDIVSVRQWLTSADYIPVYAAVRSEVIKHEPTSCSACCPGWCGRRSGWRSRSPQSARRAANLPLPPRGCTGHAGFRSLRVRQIPRPAARVARVSAP